RKYFFPFTSTNAAPNADPDGDGVINSIENIMGTDPTDPNSLLKMTSITRAANGATVVWESVTNRHYQVFSRTNLTSGAWQAVGGVITPTGASTQYLDTTGTNGTRFYRVQVLP
ncbi:MAG TPA: thrombospondin type 3 repeat-containing protein, partial [Candidatus Cybelea sp.]|nr:thrombospondin type 3 repeat-containing protein [Candidatus Cybelea sp.]